MKRFGLTLFAMLIAVSFGLTACTKSKMEVKEEGEVTPEGAVVSEEVKIKTPEGKAEMEEVEGTSPEEETE